MRLKQTAAVLVALVCVGCGTSPTNKAEGEKAPVAVQADPALPLTGFVDIPKGDEITAKPGSPVDIGGWALWGQKIQAVNILLDGSVVATAELNIARPDVAGVHPEYANPRSGWGLSLPGTQIKSGKHTLTVQVVSQSGRAETLKTIALNVR